MAASGDVTFSGDRHEKLHPYLATLVRWCVSCLWSTATVFLHRLMTAPYPAIAAPKPQQKPVPKPRAPGTDHLHPEPKVECVVLHEPPSHTLDVIFVHGLYGSLGNTWRQGDWKTKYKIDPNIVPLRKHDRSPCKCNLNKNNESLNNVNKCKINEDCTFDNLNEGVILENLNELQKILPNDNTLITEQFYNNTLLEQVNVESYETQAKFVEDMFRNKNGYDIKRNVINNHIKCNCNNLKVDDCKCKDNEVECNVNEPECKFNEVEYKINEVECKVNEVECKINEVKCKNNDKKTCETGCGCVCDECYSLCWPKDWIKMDFPGARVISINYTSDPYLWRPLWIKGNKRLRLHERAEQMMRQLLEMGVGEKPIVWVGHSKGGLFIKQIYCEAYEAYLSENKSKQNNDSDINIVKTVDSREIIECYESDSNFSNTINEVINNENEIFKEPNGNCDEAVNDNETNNKTEINNLNLKIIEEFNTNNDVNENLNRAHCETHLDHNRDNIADIKNTVNEKIINELSNNINIIKNDNDEVINNMLINNVNNINHANVKSNENVQTDNFREIKGDIQSMKVNDDLVNVGYITDENEYDVWRVEHFGTSLECDRFDVENDGRHSTGDEDDTSSSSTEDQTVLSLKAGLWRNSVGFMFYSVPHRGSPLADIKTPITARSVELLEISKDCALVLSLQERWLVATQTSQPLVRSLVETCRTLMSVLWLRIVSVDSADAGIGTLSGVSVDHREICKPSSRHCLLYTELTDLIDAALNKCDCG